MWPDFVPEGAEHAGPRIERRSTVVLRAAADDDGDALVLGSHRQLSAQPALPDAGLAKDEQRAAAAVARGRQQRAELTLLGFSAQEVAETLDSTVASVNSALQRARKATDEQLPDQSQQATLRLLGDQQVQELVATYMRAWEAGDVDTIVGLLT